MTFLEAVRQSERHAGPTAQFFRRRDDEKSVYAVCDGMVMLVTHRWFKGEQLFWEGHAECPYWTEDLLADDWEMHVVSPPERQR